MTREDMKKIIEKIVLAYPRYEIVNSQKAFEVWYECLQDLRFDILMGETLYYIKHNEYPPTIAALREAYNNAKDQYPKDEWQ